MACAAVVHGDRDMHFATPVQAAPSARSTHTALWRLPRILPTKNHIWNITKSGSSDRCDFGSGGRQDQDCDRDGESGCRDRIACLCAGPHPTIKCDCAWRTQLVQLCACERRRSFALIVAGLGRSRWSVRMAPYGWLCPLVIPRWRLRPLHGHRSRSGGRRPGSGPLRKTHS